jgi:hypothetical protein
MRPVPLWILPAFLLLIPTSAQGSVTLSVNEPLGGFTTNNDYVNISGQFTSSIDTEGTVSVSNLAGMRTPPTSILPLSQLLVYFDLIVTVSQIHITPFILDGLLLAPRRVLMSFSSDGVSFTEPVIYNTPSGGASADNVSVVMVDPAIRARFIRIDMLEGWQKQGVKVIEVEVVDSAQSTHYGLIRESSFPVDMSPQSSDFNFIVPLMVGENRLTVSATMTVPPANFPESKTNDSESFDVFRLDHLPLGDDYDTGTPIVLSDGGRLNLVIPPGATDQIDRIEITRLPTADLDPEPILAYDFAALGRVPFSAEATSYLDTQPPWLAVDGDKRDESSWVTGVTPMPVEITIDLKRLYRVGSLAVHARVDNNRSFGPKQARVLVSSDGRNFAQVAERSEFNDTTTVVQLNEIVESRYVRIEILGSKQPDNIRITEIEFRDETGTPIVTYAELRSISLKRPGIVEILLGDYIPRGVDIGKLALFNWDEELGDWRLIGGDLDEEWRTLTAEVTHLSRLGLFESNIQEPQRPSWSLNPFSPNGDGVADVTRMVIRFLPEELGDRDELTVQLFNLSGMLVRTLIDKEIMLSRSVSVQWDGTDGSGNPVPIGPYIYQVRAGDKRYKGLIVVAR